MGFVTDQQSQAVPVDDLAVGGAPRLRCERVDDCAAVCELVEPAVEHVGPGGAEEREEHTLDVHRRLVTGSIGPEQRNWPPGLHSVSDGVARTIGAGELGKGVDVHITTEDISVKLEGLTGGTRK